MSHEVTEPILGSPFLEPERHWRLGGDAPVLERGRRRADSELVDRLRKRVAEWRRLGYPGVTRTTAELLAYWQRDGRRHRLFFAQLEAVETILFLVESRPDLRQGISVPGSAGFRRYACKMATGTGKSTVMAMLAAWSILNKAHARRDARFSSVVLIVCPNLTVRDRLRELRPSEGEAAIYRTRDLVPEALLPELYRGRVVVTHWHVLQPRNLRAAMGGARVVRDLVESDASFAARLLAEGRNVLVLNDEAHHAYRIDDARDGERDAAVWVEGLDRIHRARGVNLALDFSATPVADDEPFPWLVSDFGLVEAIEAGLVKIPQRAGPADLWAGGKSAREIFEKAREALTRFVELWEEALRRGGEEAPPVLLVVCRDIALARVVHEWLSARDSARGFAIRVDSRVAEETDEELWMRFTLDTVGRRAWPADAQGRPLYPSGFREVAEKLRLPLVPPGADVRAVVSVGMVSEGWDCRTVTHVAGLRPFVSSLLCEQVVGRALRRRSYEVGADGRFAEEVAQVLGVPFVPAPFKASGGTAGRVSQRRRIFEPEERKTFSISVPRVERYVTGRRCELFVDEGLPTPRLGATETFALAAELTRRLIARGGAAPAHVLFPQWLAWLRKGRGDGAPDVALPSVDVLLRASQVRWAGAAEIAVFEARPRPPVDFWTDEAILPVGRSALNAVLVGDDERKAAVARALDAHPAVAAFADAAALGLAVPGTSRAPEFVVRLASSETLLVLDTRGGDSSALVTWAAAVTAAGTCGRWRYVRAVPSVAVGEDVAIAVPQPAQCAGIT